MYLNKVQLIGNLTRDPELKSTPSGAKVCSFSLATNETFKDAQGQKKETVEFHNIVVWGKTAENVAQYMKKGSQIYIEGKLQTRSWDKDGVKHYRTEINALHVQFGHKPSGTASVSAPAHTEAPGGEDQGLDTIEYPGGGDGMEDIPF